MIRLVRSAVVLLSLALSPATARAQAADYKPAALSERQHAEWRAIGRLNQAGFRQKGQCTATLIAPDLVLTAAHCLFITLNGESRLKDPANIIFNAGYRKGEVTASARGIRTWVHPGYLEFPEGFERVSYDIGLIRLAEPIDPALVPPLPVTFTPRPERPAAIIGYRGDRPEMLSADFRCRLLAVELRLVGLDCPVVSGNSGSPVLSQIDGTWFVVGVVSARTFGKRLIKAFAARPDEPFLRQAGFALTEPTQPAPARTLETSQ